MITARPAERLLENPSGRSRENHRSATPGKAQVHKGNRFPLNGGLAALAALLLTALFLSIASPAMAAGDPPCGDPATRVHQIQGSGTASPLVGMIATVEGVVIGDYQANGQFGGYFLQEEDADVDTNATTSEGIFVFSTTPVDVGDLVRVRGTVTEFVSLTELANVTSTLVCEEGRSVAPTPVSLPVPSLTDWERREGMQVAISQELTVTDVFTLFRFGEVGLSAGRLLNPTSVVAPGAAAALLQDLNDRSRILLDDGSNQQNPDPTLYPSGGLSASNTLRVGDSVPSLIGVLDQRLAVYRIQPNSPISFDHVNPRPATPASVGGDVKVAGFNLSNYFNGDGLGGGFPTAEGANTLTELQRQRAKIIIAIDELDADVIGLVGLENDDPSAELAAAEDLVAGLNDVAGPGAYAFVDTGIVGTHAVRVGVIYRPAAVTPAGSHAVIDISVDPRFLDTRNRPSIAQTFDLVSTGARFTTVVNDLKSRNSGCSGDPDIDDGQGDCNGTRTLAAEALVDWLATDPTGSEDPDVLLIGNMDAYAEEDPIVALKDGGYIDAAAAFLGDSAYSFVSNGQSGYLDHALASPTLSAQVVGVTQWHINADEPVALDYNTEFKTSNQLDEFYSTDPHRSSEHDPLLLGLDLAGPPTVGPAPEPPPTPGPPGPPTPDTPSTPQPADEDPPETQIIKAPVDEGTKRRVRFRFTSDEPGATFECKLDKKPFKSCTSPANYKAGEGKHKFMVRAIDAAGNVDPTADKDKFKIVG